MKHCSDSPPSDKIFFFFCCVHLKIAASTNLCWGSLNRLAVINQSAVVTEELGARRAFISSIFYEGCVRDERCWFGIFYFIFFSFLSALVQLCHVGSGAIRGNKEQLAVMNCEAKWPMSAMNEGRLCYFKPTPPCTPCWALSAHDNNPNMRLQ